MTDVNLLFRKAFDSDKKTCLEIYNAVCDWEALNGKQTFWDKVLYPNKETVEKALSAKEMYVLEADGKIVACGIINQFQQDFYKGFNWKIDASCDEVLVLHTFAVAPAFQRMGYGMAFMNYYENMAKQMSCKVLRLDTIRSNKKSQAMYKKLGFEITGEFEDDPNGVGEMLIFLGMEKAVE